MTCEHRKRNPEGVEWSIEDSLDHFTNCFSLEEQLHYWRYIREDQHIASRCRQAGHEYLIREHQEYIMVLRKKLDGKD